jgi:hypothetical protein
VLLLRLLHLRLSPLLLKLLPPSLQRLLVRPCAMSCLLLPLLLPPPPPLQPKLRLQLVKLSPLPLQRLLMRPCAMSCLLLPPVAICPGPSPSTAALCVPLTASLLCCC